MSLRQHIGAGGLAGARWALCGAVLAPLVYTTGSIYPFLVPGALWFRLLVALAGVLASVAVLSGAVRTRLRADAVAGAMAIFLVVAAVAAVAGRAPLHSLFGDFQRMGGVLAWGYVLAFYLLLRGVMDEGGWTRFLWTLSAATAAAAAVGALQAWGGAGGWHPLLGLRRVQATLGNPGYLSIFLLFGLIACGLLFRRVESTPARFVLAAVAGLEAAVLLVGSIRTSLVVLVVAGLAGGAVLATAGGARRSRARGLVLAGAVAVAVAGLWLARDTAVVRSIPTLEEAARTGLEDRSLQERLAAWGAAAEGVRESPVLGVGPENFRLVYDRHFSPDLYAHVDPPPFLDEAHDEYVEAAAETGILGGIAFLLFWLAVIRRAWRAARGGLDPPDAAFLGACVAGYAVFLLLWFRTPNTFPAFVGLVAFAGAALEGERPWLGIASPGSATRSWKTGRRAAAIAALVVALGAGLHTVALARTAHLLSEAGRSGSVAERVETYEAVVADRPPGGAEAAVEYARFVAGLDSDALGDVTGDLRRDLERGFRGARRALEAEIERDPANARHRALSADLSFSRFRFDGDSAHLERGIEAARTAAERSPPRLRYRRMLSDLYMTAGRPTAALAVLEEAKSLLGGLGELQYAIAKIHAVEDRVETAARGLERADSLGYEPEPSNRPVYATVARSLLAAGDTARAQRVVGMAGGRFNFGNGDDD